MKGAVLNRASEDVATFIVKAYKGGNDDLWALHELNILDKHRLLLPVIQVTSIVWELSKSLTGGRCFHSCCSIRDCRWKVGQFFSRSLN